MIELMLLPDSLPFAVALALMAGLGVLEVVSLLFGAGLSGFLDDLLPDSVDSPEISADIEDSGLIAKAFGWLKINEVPALIALILFLLCFGLSGLVIQGVALNVQKQTLSAGAATVAALMVCLPLLRLAVSMVKPIVPRDETDAVSRDTFEGREATIVLGTAKSGSPAQAKVFDEHGQAHYIMVEPENAELQFTEGTSVVLGPVRGTTHDAVATHESATQSHS